MKFQLTLNHPYKSFHKKIGPYRKFFFRLLVTKNPIESELSITTMATGRNIAHCTVRPLFRSLVFWIFPSFVFN